MSGVLKLTWHGDDVKAKVLRAVANGMNQTMAACVTEAMLNAPVDTGTLRADIQYAPVNPGDKVGVWGNFIVEYAIYQELGTRYIPAKRYLRNAADSQYPQLVRRIKL